MAHVFHLAIHRILLLTKLREVEYVEFPSQLAAKRDASGGEGVPDRDGEPAATDEDGDSVLLSPHGDSAGGHLPEAVDPDLHRCQRNDGYIYGLHGVLHDQAAGN